MTQGRVARSFKSTLLNIVAGLIEPDQGELWLGATRAARREDRRSLAYMFQEDRLLPWRTARANTEFGLEGAQPALSASERRRRALAALELLRIRALRNTTVLFVTRHVEGR